jgi:glycosyltransferase involved in cell wall biosynthesis
VRPLRIRYTCHDRWPSTDTNTQQIFWTLVEVARRGHQVDLSVRALPPRADAREAIAVHYGAPGGTLPDTLRISADSRRVANERLDTVWFDLTVPSRSADHDVMWTRDPLALVAAMNGPAPVVFETFRPDYALAASFAPWRRATLARAGWGRPVPRLAGVIAHSHLTAGAFVRAGVPAERCVTVHNGYSPSLMEPELARDAARAETGLPRDRALLVYTGHVGPHKGTASLLDLARAVPDASMVIVGVDDGSHERRWLDDRIDAAGVHNVIAVPRVPLASVATYLYAADCLVIPPTSEPLQVYGRTVLPMKLFSYLAAGRPIIAPRLPDIEEVVRNGETALLVEADDTSAAADAVRRLLVDRLLAARLSESCREAARGYTWAARAATIADTLDRWLRPARL